LVCTRRFPAIAHHLALRNGRHAWVQVARGAVRLNDNPLAAGDGVALSEESAVELEATAPSEALLFDLA
jgi:redox-sensitive bicupin YhaK (pirin superfamily)